MALQVAAIDEKATYGARGSVTAARVDRKIVDHLKRKLNSRIDKRLRHIYETERQRFARAEIADGRSDMAPEGKHSKHRTADSKSATDDKAGDDTGSKIFGRYDEFGQKTIPPRLPRSITSVSSLPHIHPNQPPRAHTAPETAVASGGFRGRGSSVETGLGLADLAEVKAEDYDADVDAELGLVCQDAAEEDSPVDLDGAAASSQPPVALAVARFDPLSPVPTPHIAKRPATRGGRRVSAAATRSGVDAVLAGDLTAECPPDMLVSRIYVACSGQDTRTEQKQFVQALYPQLKAMCSAQSCELQIVDMHWAMADACIDNHSYAGSCSRALASTSRCPGSLLVVFTSGKYGDCSPPPTLPPCEFEALHKSMERAYGVLLDEIEAVRQRLRQEEEAEKASSSQKTLGEQLAAEDEEEEPDSSKAGSKNQRLKHATQAIINLLALKERDAAAVKPSIIDSWYKLDENSVPPAYRLQRVSTQYPDFVKADTTRRRTARAAWADTASLLRDTLLAHAKTAAPSGAIRKAASTSLLEQEIGASLASARRGQSVMVWYSKFFDGMDADDKVSQDFAESRPEYRAKMKQLEETIRESSLPASCVNETMLEWTDEGFAPDRLRSHQLYLERLCSHLAARVEHRLSPLLQEAAAAMPADRPRRALHADVSQHATFCRTRALEFHGRKALLAEVKKYVRSDTRTPLIVHGRSGNGRKSFTCRAAWESHRWCRANHLAVIFRTCCIGGESTNLRSLLYSLCCQICVIYGQDISTVPTDFKGLVNDFADRLKSATVDRELLIVLDSLECLSDENDAKKFAWLPKEMPQHVHVLLSALTEEKQGPLEALKKIWGDGKRNVLEVGDLPQDDAVTIFDHWMKAADRRLTADQRSVVLDAVGQCPSPLYLRVVFAECLLWASYASAEQTKLPIGVKRVATIMLGRLERDHGDAVVRRALGYITASKVGVSHNELEDLLSLDEAAMDELNAHLQLPLRRCPPAVVERLLQELADVYLVQRTSGGRRVVQWAHQQFREVAFERYLLQRDKAPSYHKALSEYFLGLWSDGRGKPVGSSEETADRYVASQRLSFRSGQELGGGGGVGGGGGGGLVYNLRKLDELPYHLMGSQQFDVLKSECLCNYEWMLAKLCGLSFRALLDDYQLALAAEPRDRDLNLLLETLVLSRAVLERDPRQLGSQLMGRLGSAIQRDMQLPPQEPRQFVACHALLAQIECSSTPTFVPSVTCLTPPGAALADVLQGHQDELTAMALSEDGMRAVTASRDDTMKTWDLRSGKVLATLAGVGRDVLELVMTCGDRLAVTSELRCLRFWDLTESRCTRTVSDFHDYATLSATKDGRTVAAYFVGRNFMRSWNVDGPVASLCECQLEERAAADREKPILVSKTSVGDLVLVTHQDSGHANTQNVRTGAIVHTLKCVEPSARIIALAISNDYFVLANRFRLSKHEEPFALDLFNNQSGVFVRSVRGCCEDNITSIEVSSSGTHAICLSTSRQTWTADLAVWNLETEEHKHLSSHAGMGTLLAVNDLRYVLSACRGEWGARVWNISGAIIKPAAKSKQVTGVAALTPMKKHPKRVVVTSSDNSQISVWNLSKDKWSSGSPVRIEHGHIEPHDVVVVNNTKAVILGDRGISSVSKESIFQTMYIYDLETMSYDRKVSGVYIIPSPPREYALIGDDYLLGLSENRSHFIVWNISQGVLSHRIKPAFVTKAETTQQLNAAASVLARKRNMTAKMTPWDRRAETESAKTGRRGVQVEQELRRIEERKKEKENGIEQFLMSGNGKVIVASYFAHHLCVFDVDRRDHVQTLEDDASVLHLYAAALTHDGGHLALSNYDEESRTSYVTLWNCFGGEVQKRLRNERDVRAIGISDDGRRVVIGKGQGELRVWRPAEKGSVRKLTPYPGFRFLPTGNKAFVLRGGSIALLFAGDVSAWDLDAGVNLAVYTPDTKISSLVTALDGRLISFGLCDSTSAVALRLVCRRSDDASESEAAPSSRNMLGELPEDSDAD